MPDSSGRSPRSIRDPRGSPSVPYRARNISGLQGANRNVPPEGDEILDLLAVQVDHVELMLLEHLGLSSEAPTPAPARAPPRMELGF